MGSPRHFQDDLGDRVSPRVLIASWFPLFVISSFLHFSQIFSTLSLVVAGEIWPVSWLWVSHSTRVEANTTAQRLTTDVLSVHVRVGRERGWSLGQEDTANVTPRCIWPPLIGHGEFPHYLILQGSS